jgi:hypothetical protein
LYIGTPLIFFCEGRLLVLMMILDSLNDMMTVGGGGDGDSEDDEEDGDVEEEE